MDEVLTWDALYVPQTFEGFSSFFGVAVFSYGATIIILEIQARSIRSITQSEHVSFYPYVSRLAVSIIIFTPFFLVQPMTWYGLRYSGSLKGAPFTFDWLRSSTILTQKSALKQMRP